MFHPTLRPKNAGALSSDLADLADPAISVADVLPLERAEKAEAEWSDTSVRSRTLGVLGNSEAPGYPLLLSHAPFFRVPG